MKLNRLLDSVNVRFYNRKNLRFSYELLSILGKIPEHFAGGYNGAERNSQNIWY